jgi:hypothetical protein
MVVSILTGAQTILRLAERSEKHRSIAVQYGSIRREIERIDNIENMDSAVLAKITERLDRVSHEAPIVSEKIRRRFELLDDTGLTPSPRPPHRPFPPSPPSHHPSPF